MMKYAKTINFSTHSEDELTRAFDRDLWNRFKKGELLISGDGSDTLVPLDIIRDTLDAGYDISDLDGMMEEIKGSIINRIFFDKNKLDQIDEDMIEVMLDEGLASSYEDFDGLEEKDAEINGLPYTVVHFYY